MIRFGILGFGLHAVKRVMPGFAAAKNCLVTALSRRDIGKAQESARRFNIPLAFDSAEELCRSSEVDAVFVTTPNACHLSDVLLAINCGKPVLCEKPMAVNADECRRMVEAARESKLLLGVAQVFRFENSTARLRERIAAGQIGRPIFARSEFSFQAAGGHPRTWLYDRADDGLNVEHPITLELRRDGAIAESETVLNQGAYARQVDAFAAAVEGTSEFPVPGKEGWQNQEILDAAYLSLKSGRAEPVERVVGPRAWVLSSQPISLRFKG